MNLLGSPLVAQCKQLFLVACLLEETAKHFYLRAGKTSAGPYCRNSAKRFHWAVYNCQASSWGKTKTQHGFPKHIRAITRIQADDFTGFACFKMSEACEHQLENYEKSIEVFFLRQFSVPKRRSKFWCQSGFNTRCFNSIGEFLEDAISKSKMQMLKSFSAFTQGYIVGRFLLGFSQCNSRMPDWIPAWCFEASLSRQNGFSSLIEPSSCLIWFLLNLLTYSAIISYKKAKVGPELGPKSDQELEPKSGPELEPKLGPQLDNWDQKEGQNWKTHFALILGPFFGTNFGLSFGTKLGQVHMELRVSIQHWKSPETRVTVKEMTKPTKHN